jgi:hypothetical protein
VQGLRLSGGGSVVFSWDDEGSLGMQGLWEIQMY